MSNDIQRIDSNERLSRIVVHGGVVYVAGVTAGDISGDIGAQTRDVLAKIDGYLQQAGTSKSRLLTVLNKHLAGKEWVAGDTYTIADMAIFPWIRNMIVRYNAEALIGWGQYPEVSRVLSHWLQRPAVQRGLLIP